MGAAGAHKTGDFLNIAGLRETDVRRAQLSRKLRSFRERLGCLSLRSAFASI